MQPQQKREVDALISQLEAAGRSQQPRPLQNPLLFGNYNVAYTSSGDDQRGQRECRSNLHCDIDGAACVAWLQASVHVAALAQARSTLQMIGQWQMLAQRTALDEAHWGVSC
jgi:hypothetical protein